MSNIRNLNQGGNPFFDWIASLDGSNSNHPFSAAYNPEIRESRGPPPEYGPPPHEEGEAPPPPPPEEAQGPWHHGQPAHDHPFGPGFPFGGRRRGGPHHPGGPHGYRGHHGHGRGGGWGGRGRCGERSRNGWPMSGNFDMSRIGEFISQFVPDEVLAGTRGGFTNNNNNNSNKDASKDSKDFTPPADIFDTEDAYVVHISLAGAKKEDVGVNWNADDSELNVAGVIYRPGDEEFLKTLALDERKVGVFERKVKLGTKATPAQVDSDAISAKMEDGVLVVTIPKLDNDIVEVKKVDIE